MSSGEARDDGLARADALAPIESYGVIGDSKSIALVARDGAIDWWGAPVKRNPDTSTVSCRVPRIAAP